MGIGATHTPWIDHGGGGSNRSGHSAGPGDGPWAVQEGSWECPGRAPGPTRFGGTVRLRRTRVSFSVCSLGGWGGWGVAEILLLRSFLRKVYLQSLLTHLPPQVQFWRGRLGRIGLGASKLSKLLMNGSGP